MDLDYIREQLITGSNWRDAKACFEKSKLFNAYRIPKYQNKVFLYWKAQRRTPSQTSLSIKSFSAIALQLEDRIVASIPRSPKTVGCFT